MVVQPVEETGPVAWKAFWGKWGFSNDDHLADSEVAVHPLFCHMADVAAVAQALWEEVSTPDSRQSLRDRLRLPTGEAAMQWIAFFAGSHDLGKATLAFSLQKPRAAGPLKSVGLRTTPAVSEPPRRDQPHGLATAVLLPPLLRDLGVDRRVARRVGDLLGGHHGIIPSSDVYPHIALQERTDPLSNDARRALLSSLMDICAVPRETPPAALDVSTALLLAGLTSVADWIGSNTTFFPYQARLNTMGLEPRDPMAYAARAHEQAQRALRDLGWTRHLSARSSGLHLHLQPAESPTSGGSARFRALFGGRDPLPMQRTTIEVADTLGDGGLAIIEAPMGEGKTEAALYLAAAWLDGGRARGAYFALPTQATSDQMFGRVRDFLARLLPGSGVELQLLHGHAALSAEFARLRDGGRTFDVQNLHDEAARSGAGAADVRASEWFTYRKRGLLAPFGVGTVDQALLAALVTRHVFVRLFGLSDKVVIVDEVHAYDVYTSDLLKGLLTWLGALRSPVVLLSATLPSMKKRELAAAYAAGAGWPEQPVEEQPYPRITWASVSGTGVQQVDTSERSRKTIHVHWMMDGRRPQTERAGYPLGEALVGALQEGGCAAVICNTVASAQQTYRALRRYFGSSPALGSIGLSMATDGESELDLLHARFPFIERQRRELRARRRFGPPQSMIPSETEDGSESRTTSPVARPHRAVLVATQVIEQSLDLDFDLMVSEMAPLDLLLQRTGRLHRHPRDRPRGLSQPLLWLLAPEVADDLPRFDAATTDVYAEHILLRSWLALRRRMQAVGELTVAIPADVSDLIEEVYDARDPPAGPPQLVKAWEQTQRKLKDESETLTHEASVRRLDGPDAEDAEPLARYTSNAVEEDQLELHPRFQALTRWGPPNVTVVVLYQQGVAYSLDSGGAHPIDPQRKARDLEEVKALLRHSIPVSTQRLTRHLLRVTVPRGWQESPLLNHCRPLVLDPADRSTQIGQFRVRLDPDEGLVIEAPKKEVEEPE